MWFLILVILATGCSTSESEISEYNDFIEINTTYDNSSIMRRTSSAGARETIYITFTINNEDYKLHIGHIDYSGYLFKKQYYDGNNVDFNRSKTDYKNIGIRPEEYFTRDFGEEINVKGFYSKDRELKMFHISNANYSFTQFYEFSALYLCAPLNSQMKQLAEEFCWLFDKYTFLTDPVKQNCHYLYALAAKNLSYCDQLDLCKNQCIHNTQKLIDNNSNIK